MTAREIQAAERAESQPVAQAAVGYAVGPR